MSLSDHTYHQPEKNTVRERVISESVKALTVERDSSPVVTIETFNKTMDYCCRFLDKLGQVRTHEDVRPDVDKWTELHGSRVASKRPSDLQVLFLAGPTPTNDLMVFRQHGIELENIWAIERDKETFETAVMSASKQGIRVKLHRGSLDSFFELVPQQFDIVYFDATAPLFGGKKPNTIQVIKELFFNQRLSPLAVLITNFAEATKDTKSKEAWERRVGIWAYANGTMDTFTEHFPDFISTKVKPHFQEYYGEFVTKFLIRFAAQLMPWWRVAALPGAKKEYFNDEKTLAEAAVKTNSVELLTNGLYPLLRLVLFTSWHLDPHDVMARFFSEPLKKAKLGDAVKIASLIRTFYEITFDGVSGSTKHILDACSPGLAKVLGTFEWFDQRKRIFCDIPFPNLITDLLLGLYGFPYHVNTKKIKRYAYKAKETVMFTDVLVFDQARYAYDLLPTLPLFDTDFSLSQQLVLRVCMDAMHRHCHYGCKDVFWGSALAGLGEEGFSHWLPAARECVGNSGVSFKEPDADGNEVWDDSFLR